MDLFFGRIDHFYLFETLKNEDVHKTLAYMVDYREHTNLKVTDKRYSIEISNSEITIAIILFVGFEKEEYKALLEKTNVHIIAFDTQCKMMLEFKKMKIKHIEYLSLFFMTLSRSKNRALKSYKHLLNLSSGNYSPNNVR